MSWFKNIEWFEVKYSVYRWYRNSFINKAYLWFAYRFIPKHRYNVLRTGMKPTYADINVRVESALSQVLIDFVELEAYPQAKTTEEAVAAIHLEMDNIAADKNEHWDSTNHIQQLIEMRELYVWCKFWHGHLTCEEDSFYNEHTKRYDFEGRKAFDSEVDNVMIRLVKIRNFLWT